MPKEQRLTRRDRKTAETGEAPKRKLTQEEQDEEDEKKLEEWCEKWCGRVIRLVTLGSLFWGLLTSVSEWVFRPPVLLEAADLTGKLFVLTGGTSGMGAAAARQLARDGGRLVLGVRNLTLGESFAEALRLETGNSEVEARYLDLAQLDSVVAFSNLLMHEPDGIAGLINSGATAEESCLTTVDGFERSTQVNYLAPALLTRLLVPALEVSGEARVVHVTCPAAFGTKFDVASLLAHLEPMPDVGLMVPDSANQCDGAMRYAGSKLMLTAFSASLSKRRSGAAMAVTSNVYDPGGAVNTPGYEGYQPKARASRRGFAGIGPQVIIRKVLGYVLAPVLAPIGRFMTRKVMRQADEGGHGMVHVLTSPHLTRVSGKVYSLSSSGFTRASGCVERTRDECGLLPTPANVPGGMDATSLWDATLAALKPWLERRCKARSDGTEDCSADSSAATARGVRPTGGQYSEWDSEE